MNVEELREYCLQKKGVTESFPFDDVSLVMKVGSKIFAIISLDTPFSINLKCDPDKAISLREQHACVLPGYHMNKKHWNTVMIDGSVPDKLIFEWTDHSYTTVLNSLTKAEKKKIE